ncbi:MAG TPA: serine/threonine-protein kinase, partial [Longilinea sp.]|nr:serine/threonine-protein kinase [Longilinea sp.]
MEQLGQGGMATVYKAYDPALDRFVALKVLHPAFTEDSTFINRFEREAKVIAKLEHPNIVPIYNYAQFEKRPFLVMKYVEGETLKARLQREHSSLAIIFPILEKIGEALTYAHSRGVIHRDIKPSNVLLASDGLVYLADFGLAKIALNTSSSLTADQMIGTPQYISPEQALAKNDLDFRTDIYSLGILIYEIAVGRVPYNADTPFAVVHDHIYTPLPLPSQVNPQVDPGVERVLLKALAKDPADRYQSVAAMITDLRGCLLGTGKSQFGLPLFPKKDPSADVTVQAPVKKGRITPIKLPPISSAGGSIKNEKNKSGNGIWIGFAIGCVSFCVITIVGIILLIVFSPDEVAQEIQDAGIPPMTTLAPAPPVGTNTTVEIPPEIQIELDTAIQALSDGDTEQGNQIIRQVANEISGDQVLMNEVFAYLHENQAYLLAVEALFSQPGTSFSSIVDTYREQGHELLYLAAGDENSGDFFSNNTNELIFAVASLRWQLYFGDDIDAVQSGLLEIQDNPILDQRYPEADLLQAEIYFEEGDYEAASDQIDIVIETPNQAEWIVNLALDLAARIP